MATLDHFELSRGWVGGRMVGGRMVGGWVDSGLVDGCLGKIKNIDHLSPAELKLGLS